MLPQLLSTGEEELLCVHLCILPLSSLFYVLREPELWEAFLHHVPPLRGRHVGRSTAPSVFVSLRQTAARAPLLRTDELCERGRMDRDYGHGSYGGQRSMDSYLNQSYGMDNHSGGGGGSRFGPYESYDSRSSLGGRDLYRSGYGFNEPEQSRFGGSYGGRFESSYRNSLDSFGGSRGRGTPAYPESTFGSRNYDAFGGPSTGRGRGRGHMSDFGSIHRPGIVVDYQNKPTNVTVAAARGIKRKMMQPFNKPSGTFVKKPKLAKPVEKTSLSKSPTKTDPKNEEEEKRRIEARREKQRRRREKNSEKYGDGYRMAFTCSFCKFRTFEEKDIELHLESSSHQETLDHIQKQTKFDKVVMEFLHECMVNKFKKTSIRKQQTNNQTEVVKIIEKDVMEGVAADDHMMKVETVHCSACSVYIPALHSSVQQHLKSPDHIKGKQAYKEQIKRESVLTATSILNNPIVKARYERFVKPLISSHLVYIPVSGEEEEKKVTQLHSKNRSVHLEKNISIKKSLSFLIYRVKTLFSSLHKRARGYMSGMSALCPEQRALLLPVCVPAVLDATRSCGPASALAFWFVTGESFPSCILPTVASTCLQVAHLSLDGSSSSRAPLESPETELLDLVCDPDSALPRRSSAPLHGTCRSPCPVRAWAVSPVVQR
ncbi:zinc finger protein 326 [Camelus ferus]|nr:zinc finger protein 326 [Camelus ferus]